MTAKKMVSEREAVMRERAAFREGAMTQEGEHRGALHCSHFSDLARVGARANEHYPLPKIERPRVMREHLIEWRVRDEILECRFVGDTGPWAEAMNVLDAGRRKLLADLLTKPTELVDDDGSVSASGPEGRASSEETNG